MSTCTFFGQGKEAGPKADSHWLHQLLSKQSLVLTAAACESLARLTPGLCWNDSFANFHWAACMAPCTPHVVSSSMHKQNVHVQQALAGMQQLLLQPHLWTVTNFAVCTLPAVIMAPAAAV
jgi:hypothetical protein